MEEWNAGKMETRKNETIRPPIAIGATIDEMNESISFLIPTYDFRLAPYALRLMPYALRLLTSDFWLPTGNCQLLTYALIPINLTTSAQP